jgi:hypothetical protein
LIHVINFVAPFLILPLLTFFSIVILILLTALNVLDILQLPLSVLLAFASKNLLQVLRLSLQLVNKVLLLLTLIS